MGKRLSRIYTRTGDDGTTGLGDGTRIAKDSLRVSAYGAVDELNSVLGLLLTEALPESVQARLEDVQHDLFDIGGELCIPGHSMMTAQRVDGLERWLDELNDDLPALENFILPGGNRAAATCHLARTVCRRAEREIVTLSRQEDVSEPTLAYVNRLSDLLFVIARVLARQDGGTEVLWRHDRK